MKTGRSLSELAIELERQKESKKDYVAPTKELMVILDQDVLESHEKGEHIIDATRLLVNGYGEFGVNEIAHGQIAQRVGIPQKYYDRMLIEAPTLLANNVNHWFKNKPENRMIRTLDGNARAFLSSRYRTIDNLPIAEIALDTLTSLGKMRVESSELTEKRMYIKAVTEEVSFEVKQGDVVQAGIVISNSEVGLGSVKVEPLLFRLACLNGMIVADHSMRKYHIGRGLDVELAEELYRDETRKQDDKAFMMKVRDVIQRSFNQEVFEKVANKLTVSINTAITGDPVKVVEVTQKKFGLNDGERSGVLRHLIQGGDLNQWGLLNAITRTAQDVPDYDRATDLERMGGAVLELPKNDWEAIAKAA